MFNKKNLFILIILSFYFTGCGKKVTVDFPATTDMSINEAYNLVINEVKNVYTPKNMEYQEMLIDGDGKSVVFVWKGNKKAYYIRHWLYDGDNLRVEISWDDSNYIVSLKSNGGDTGDCYGYTNSMPVPKPMRFDIYWNNSYKNGCYQYVRFYFANRNKAIRFAQAMKLIFVDNNISDVVSKLEDNYNVDNEYPEKQRNKPKSEIRSNVTSSNNTNIKTEIKNTDKSDRYIRNKREIFKINKRKKQTNSKCSVEKIMKMREIGLYWEEIKKICE